MVSRLRLVPSRRAQTTSQRVRPDRRRGRRIVLESLEPRQLLSGPGAGTVQVASLGATSASVTFTKTADWQTGFTGNIAITNQGSTAINGWTIGFDFGPSIDSLWNATLVSRSGTRYTLKDAGYNATIGPGATVSFGFNGSPGNLQTTPLNYTLNGVAVGPATPLPTIAIADASKLEGGAVAGSGFLRTSGNQIVDASNQAVRVAGVNWFGMETTNFAPHGLWSRSYKDMMDQMKQLGFNTIRLPYSSQAFDASSSPNGIDYNKNPELRGLNALQILDKIVEHAGKIGLRILLDHHRSTAGNSAQESGMWYTPAYPESRWVSDWVMLASRYKGNAAVIGADLHNEPHGPATWGSGDAATDWRLAAEKAGNAILAANPDWLIVVEGVQNAKSGSTWWGGNLSSAGDFPVRLNVPNRLVYSPHEYPASVYEQTWFKDPAYPNNLPAIWDKNWGYLFRQGTAPVLIGEFGSKLATTSDQQWANKLVQYLTGDLDGNGTRDLATGQQGASWTWWSWNPNSTDTGGILKDDWLTPDPNKVNLLKPVQFALAPASGATNTIEFTVSLSQASTLPISFQYATVNGTATAPGDLAAASGTVTFAAGETRKTIVVSLIGDAVQEPDETFRVVLSNPMNATIQDGDATGTILNDDGPALPRLDIGDATVTEGQAGSTAASFVVTLSAASTKTITVAYATAAGTATAGSDFTAGSGVLTFAPGETRKTLTVAVLGDTTDEPDEMFMVNLSGATNAAVGDGQGAGLIRDDDEPPPPLPTLSIEDASVGEGNSATVNAVFNVTLSAASAVPVTVGFATANDTATGLDYNPASGTLTFAAGETRKTVTVAVRGDTTVEPNERFLVQLSGPAGATLLRGTAQGTIVNDDSAAAGSFNYGEAVQKAIFFYEAQRSGDLPSNYIVDWRADTAMGDGSDVGVDLTGGYWDAGDHVKFGLPMASSMTLLAWGASQYRDGYARAGQLDRILSTIRWGTDWLVKAHTAPNEFWGQVGRGDLDHAYWGPAEVMTMARPAFKIDAQHPGSDLAGEAAAALAAASLVFRPTDPAYAATLLTHAEQLYSFATTYRGKYSDSITDAASYYNSYSGYTDELVWAGVWLHRATGKASYLAEAEAEYGRSFAGQTMTWTHSWDDKRYGAAVLLAQSTGKATYKTDAERWLDYWTVGINGGATRINYTPGGLAFLNGWGSLRYASTTAFLALVYADTVRDVGTRYHDFALGQINYILGNNPRQSSYLVGFGVNSPKNAHHRGASGVWDGNVANPAPNRHVLYGALVGGPESADDFNYHDDRTNYISNEVALDYNAGLTGALARLAMEYGGQPLATFPIPEPRTDEFFVQASVNQQGTTFTEIRGLLNNRSAWPARSSTELSFRYYVDLSETYAAGYTSNDVQVLSYYSQGATLSALQPWDAALRIYYVDVSFKGTAIGPGAGTFAKEAQVRIGLKSGIPAAAWNPANDWSYQGLLSGRDNLIKSDAIPVYETGTKLLFGRVPAASPPGTESLSIEPVTVDEGNTGTKSAGFVVRLSRASTKTVTVSYQTNNGSAIAGSDFLGTSGMLTFAPGTTAQTIVVPIVGDTVAEGNETFSVSLSRPTNAVIGSTSATGTIRDDDAPRSSVSVALKINDDWGAGYVADIVITNNGSTAIEGWLLEFDLTADIVSVWNGDLVKRVGSRYTVRNRSYNGTIAPGQSVSLGFQATATGSSRALSNVALNGKAV